jgi:hypothetical protein
MNCVKMSGEYDGDSIMDKLDNKTAEIIGLVFCGQPFNSSDNSVKMVSTTTELACYTGQIVLLYKLFLIDHYIRHDQACKTARLLCITWTYFCKTNHQGL